MAQEESKTEKKFPATIVRIIDGYTVVINLGKNDGISQNQRFLIYSLGKEEILDPDTGKKLGKLEIPKGTGKPTHIMESMTIIKSVRVKITTSTRLIRKKPSRWDIINPVYGTVPKEEEEIVTPSEELLPFEDPQVGDKVKPI